jgi:hypothetical protein
MDEALSAPENPRSVDLRNPLNADYRRASDGPGRRAGRACAAVARHGVGALIAALLAVPQELVDRLGDWFFFTFGDILPFQLSRKAAMGFTFVARRAGR